MVKVVSTARRADAVRCIGCGINGQLQRGYFYRAHVVNIIDENQLDVI